MNTDVVQLVAGIVQPDHQAVADQLVLADALDVGDVLDAHLRVGRQGGGEREQQSEQAKEPDHRQASAVAGAKGFCANLVKE